VIGWSDLLNKAAKRQNSTNQQLKYNFQAQYRANIEEIVS
jgi:hypothetical protein